MSVKRHTEVSAMGRFDIVPHFRTTEYRLRRSRATISASFCLMTVACICFANSAQSEQVFGTSQGNFQPNGSTTFTGLEIGHQIVLAGNDRVLNSIQVLFTPQDEEVTADFKFRFYANDGPAGAPGTLIGESATFAQVTLSGDYFGVGTGIFLSPIILPDTLTWTVEISNSTPIAVGVPHMMPPAALGQHLATWFGSLGSWTLDDDAPLFEVSIFATPEPSSGWLMVSGLVAMAWAQSLRRRDAMGRHLVPG